MSAASINNAVSKISKGADVREEMALTMGPYANWQEFLVVAPICVGLLGELIAISTAADFSLEKKPPKDGFKLIKWPNSFRASLVQVANSGWEAFNMAQNNMQQINLLTANIPGNLKDAVKILLQGSNEEVAEMLPIPMNAIKATADQCLSLAEAVEAKYVFVMTLTAELLEACVSARGEYEHELKETEIDLQVVRENKKTAEEQKQMSKKAYDELEKSVKKAEENYYQAMDSMPTGWDLLGMSVVEGLKNSLTTALDGAVNIELQKSGGAPQEKNNASTAPKAEGNTNTTGASKPSAPTVDAGARGIYTQVVNMQQYTNLLSTQCVATDTLKKPIRLEKIIYVKKQLDSFLKGIRPIATTQDGVKHRAVICCTDGIKICEEITELSKSMQVEDKEEKSVAEKILRLQDDVTSLAMEGGTALNSSPTSIQGPNQRMMSAEGSADGSYAQAAVQNARFKVEQSSANLEFTREKYNKACDKMMETSQKLGEVMAEMQKLDIRKMDFEKIKQTLIRGIKALGQLREEWAKLVKFFAMMSNIIRCSLNTSLKNFLDYGKQAQSFQLKGYPITSLIKDTIYYHAFQSAKIGYFVNMISGTYVEVSAKHVMDQIAGLGKLLGYDPEKEANAIEGERRKLLQGTQAAQEAIKLLVEKRKSEFDGQVKARIAKIKTELEEVLPKDGSSLQANERIKNAVKRGVETVKESKSYVHTSGLDIDDFIL